jgi:hypothetical protein
MTVATDSTLIPPDWRQPDAPRAIKRLLCLIPMACAGAAALADPPSDGSALTLSDELTTRVPWRVAEPVEPLPPPNLSVTPTLSLWLTRQDSGADNGLDSILREKRTGMTIALAQSLAYDSNVFRFDSRASANANGFAQTSDWSGRTRLALALDKTYSRQRLQLDYELTRAAYEHFDFLDHTAQVGSVRWSRADDQGLNLGVNADYRKELEDFGSFRSPVRSMRETQRLAADGFFRLRPELQLGARLEGERRRYPDGTRPANELDVHGADLVLRYTPTSGNSLAITGRRTQGNYPSLGPASGLVKDTEYDQDELFAELTWLSGTGSRLLASAGRVARRYANSLASDFSGNVGQLGAEWQITPRTQIVGAIRYTIGPADDLATRYVSTRGTRIGMVWQHSPKLRMEARLEQSKDSYQGDPGNAADAPPARADSNHTLALEANYQLGVRTLLVLDLAREERNSNLPGLDYETWSAVGRVQWAY